MLDNSPSAPTQTSDGREPRRRAIRDALRAEADAVLDRMADELADLPDHKAFGAIEYTLRDLAHQLAAKAHQAGLDAGKKRGTAVPASPAPTATVKPPAAPTVAAALASSATAASPS